MIIFAIDDEENALKLLCRAIKACQPDATLYSYGNSQEALEAAKRYQPNVVFLDIRMPGIDGIELGKQLKANNPQVNLIFTTGYSDYALDAMKMHSSGYLLKPVTKEDVANELNNLRNPIQIPQESRIHARTFGNFELFINGKPVVFRRAKAKELMAYLIDRRGAAVNRKEMAAVIFEDGEYTRANQAYLSQLVKNLVELLKNYDAEELLIVGYNSYAVDLRYFSCDAYDYMDGVPSAINAYKGEYMAQYSWGEESRYRFE